NSIRRAAATGGKCTAAAAGEQKPVSERSTIPPPPAGAGCARVDWLVDSTRAARPPPTPPKAVQSQPRSPWPAVSDNARYTQYRQRPPIGPADRAGRDRVLFLTSRGPCRSDLPR